MGTIESIVDQYGLRELQTIVLKEKAAAGNCGGCDVTAPNSRVMQLPREEDLFAVAQKAVIYELTYRERKIVSAIYEYVSRQQS